MAADARGPAWENGAPDEASERDAPKRTPCGDPPPPGFLDLGNGELRATRPAFADDCRAAAGWLYRHYPDGVTGPSYSTGQEPVIYNMGYQLRRMIDDGAPREWTPLMRLVAGLIADDARDPDDEHPLPDGERPWSAMPVDGEIRRNRWRDGIAEKSGMSTRAISRTLADLAAAGYEMRSPIAGKDGKPVTDRRGRVVFAARGHALRFQVPRLLPRPELEWSPDMASIDDADVFAQPVDNSESSPDLASNEGESSPLLVRMVAESGDPIPSASPNVKTVPQAAAAQLAQDQSQDQGQSRVGDGVDDKAQPVDAGTGPQSNPLSNSQNRRVHQGPETVAGDDQESPFHDAESTTTGSCARESPKAEPLSESAEPADSDATTTPAVDPEEHQRRELARLEAWMHESSREPRDYFPEFWDAYPRKVDRKKALAAWKTAIGDLGADPAQVVEVAARFAKEQWRLGTEQRYIPLPATWLGDERWTDEYEPPRNRGFWEN